MVEYGVESTDDDTLKRINRGHDFATSADAIRRTAAAGLPVGAHIILGLPGEKRDTLAAQARLMSSLPITTLKLHQLQIIRGTRMAEEYLAHPEEFHLFELDEYIETAIGYLENLRPDIIVERFSSQSPKELLLAPDWGIKNHELADKIKRRMKELDTWQGRHAKTIIQ
jgi:radical SAM protein (TIGR01212 family)